MKDPPCVGHVGPAVVDTDASSLSACSDEDDDSDYGDGGKLVIDLEATAQDSTSPQKTLVTMDTGSSTKVKIRRPKTCTSPLSCVAMEAGDLTADLTSAGLWTSTGASPPATDPATGNKLRTQPPPPPPPPIQPPAKKCTKDKTPARNSTEKKGASSGGIDPYEFNAKVEDGFGLPVKRMKMNQPSEKDAPVSPVPDTRAVGVETCTSIGLMTEPDCLGPCDPGTHVTLEGIVWQETDNGMLVVNVTWRGKTYVGTLMDSTKHEWAPPNLRAESPQSDVDNRTPKGRGARRGRTTTRAQAAAAVTAETERKLRSSRRTSASTMFTAPPSPARSTGDNSNNGKRKSRTVPDIESDETTSVKAAKRPRSSSRSGIRDISEAVNKDKGSEDWLICPEANCQKKFRNTSGLKYHQSHSHRVETEEIMDIEIKFDAKESKVVAKEVKDNKVIAKEIKDSKIIAKEVKDSKIIAKETKDSKVIGKESKVVVVTKDSVKSTKEGMPPKGSKSREKTSPESSKSAPPTVQPTKKNEEKDFEANNGKVTNNNNSKNQHNNNSPKKKKDSNRESSKSKSGVTKPSDKKDEVKVMEVTKVVPVLTCQQHQQPPQPTKVLMAPLTLAKTVSGTTQVYQLASAPLATMTVVTTHGGPTIVTTGSQRGGATMGTSSTISGIHVPVTLATVTSAAGNKKMNIYEKVVESRSKMSGKPVTLTVTRPIMPAPGPTQTAQIVKVSQTATVSAATGAVITGAVAHLKQIQPKPVAVPEQTSVNPALPQEKKKSKKKKKSKDKESKSKNSSSTTTEIVSVIRTAPPMVVTAQTVTPPIGTPSSGPTKLPSARTKASSPPSKAAKVPTPPPIVTAAKPLPTPPSLSVSRPTPEQPPPELKRQHEQLSTCQRPPSRPSPGLLDATSAATATTEAPSPAYSDISDANEAAPMLENEAEHDGKVASTSVEAGVKMSLGPVTLPGFPSASTSSSSQYGQPPYLTPAVFTQQQQASQQQLAQKSMSDAKLSPTCILGAELANKIKTEKVDEKFVSNIGAERVQSVSTSHFSQHNSLQSQLGCNPYKANDQRGKCSPPIVIKQEVRSLSPAQGSLGKPPGLISDRERQNNEQILKENIELKTQMDRQQQHQQQQQNAAQYDPLLLRGRQEEELRRFYMFTQQHQQPPLLPKPQASPKDLSSPRPERSQSRETVESRSRSPSTGRKNPTPTASSADTKRIEDKLRCNEKMPSPRTTPTLKERNTPTSSFQAVSTANNFMPGHYFFTSPYGAPAPPALLPSVSAAGPMPFDLIRPQHFPHFGYPPPPYLHPSQIAPDPKAIELLQQQHQQYYACLPPPPAAAAAAAASHKIHELKEMKPRGDMRSPVSPAVSVEGEVLRTPPPRPGSSASSPPPQRHLHTHHHTHVVGPPPPAAGFTLYGYGGAPNQTVQGIGGPGSSAPSSIAQPGGNLPPQSHSITGSTPQPSPTHPFMPK